MIRADYLRICGRLGYVESAGDGPPVLCLHTAGQSGVQWRHVLKELPSFGYSVIVPDLPGHGRSEPAADGPVDDLRAYTEWCLRLIELLNLDQPFIVGCSIGGKVALDLAANWRAQSGPAGIVAMEADAWNSHLNEESLRWSLEDAASPSRADRSYVGTVASCGRSVPPERAAMIATMHRREDPLVSTCDLIAWSRFDIRAQLGLIRCPALLLAGDDDFWINPSDVAWAASRMRNAAFSLLPGVGHYPMEEITNFTELLADWLGALAAGVAPIDIARRVSGRH